MVSVSKIGQIFNSPTNFSSSPNKNNISNKAEIKSHLKQQTTVAYATMGAGVLALAGSTLKRGVLKYIAPIPAACIAIMLGSNMLKGAKDVEKVIDNIEPFSKDKVIAKK